MVVLAALGLNKINPSVFTVLKFKWEADLSLTLTEVILLQGNKIQAAIMFPLKM